MKYVSLFEFIFIKEVMTGKKQKEERVSYSVLWAYKNMFYGGKK